SDAEPRRAIGGTAGLALRTGRSVPRLLDRNQPRPTVAMGRRRRHGHAPLRGRTMTSSTHTIDFLPERYRQAKKRRHTSAWRLAVTLVFVVAFVGAAGGLYVAQRDV